jgi:phenylacetic acid degradation protein
VVHACRIGRNALIGVNATVFDGAVIGECSIVAALSFVKANFVVPPRHLAAGVPAKIVRPLQDAEIAKKTTGTMAYRLLARRCLETLHPCLPLAAAEDGRRRIDVSSYWPEEILPDRP